jgi:hypothetical protein
MRGQLLYTVSSVHSILLRTCVIEVAFAGSVRPYAYLCLFLAYDGCVTRALQQLPRSCGHRLDAGHAEPVR